MSKFKIALPILAVKSSDAAEDFYGGKLGFRTAYAYRPKPEQRDPCWLGVVRDGAHVVLSSFSGDGTPGSRSLQIYVENVGAVQRELRAAGVACGDELMDQDYGNLEFQVRDPDGNQLIFAQEQGA